MANTLEIFLNGNSKDLEAALSSAEKKLAGFSSKMKDIGQSLSLRLTAPLALAGGAAIKLASDFEESLNKVNVAFKDSSKDVQAFAKTTLKSFGIAEGTALDMAALFGDMSTSMGLSTGQAAKLSTSMVGLAGDLASFKNMNIEEVTTALNGVFTGETESLKRLGIVMTEVNLKQFAMEKGIKKNLDQMTQSEKVLLRYQYVMKNTANAQGDFERTGGGAANQMRMFNESLKELGVQFGSVILPAVTQIITKFNSILGYLRDLSPATKTFILTIAGIAAATGPLLFLAGSILPKVLTGFKLLTSAAGKFNLTIGKGGALGVLIAGLGYVAESAYDYNKALGETNKLTEDQKKNLDVVLETNEAIKKKISLLQQEYKTAGQVQLQTGLNTAQITKSKAQVKSQIEEQAKLYKQNKAIIAQLTKAQNADVGGVGPDLTVLGGDTASAAEKFDFSALSSKINDLNKDIFSDLQSVNKTITSEQENVLKRFLATTSSKGQEFGKLIKGFFNQDITQSEFFTSLQKLYGQVSNIATPFAVMEQGITASTVVLQEQLALQAEQFNIYMQAMDMLKNATAQVFQSIGNSIVNSFGLAKTGLEGFLGAMLNVLVQMGAMAIAESIFGKKKVATKYAESQANAITIGTNAAAASGPAGIATIAPFIAAAMGVVQGAFSAIPAFAKGGIVSGPTMGLMGEYMGAKSNPEVIAPLSRLQSMLDNGGGNDMNLSGEFVVRGQDLILALQRAEKTRNRIG
jgi:hypothetical protein